MKAMKAVLLVALLSGCTSQYVVDDRSSSENCTTKTTYVCDYSPWFFLAMDKTMMVCETREECNAYCAQLRKTE